MNFLITILCILLVLLMFYFVYIKPRSTDGVYVTERSYDDIYYDSQNVEHQILDYVTSQREKLPGGGKLLGGQTLQDVLNDPSMAEYLGYTARYYTNANDIINEESNTEIKKRLSQIQFKYDLGSCDILSRIGRVHYTHLYNPDDCSFFGNEGSECWISAFMNTYILAGFDLSQGAPHVDDPDSPTGKGLLSTEYIRQNYMPRIPEHTIQPIEIATDKVSHLYNVHCKIGNIEVLNYLTLNESFADMTAVNGGVPVYHLPWFIRSRLVCFAMNVGSYHYKACCVVDGNMVFVVNDGHLEGNQEIDIREWDATNGAVPIQSYFADVATSKLKYYTLEKFMEIHGNEINNGYTIELIVNNTGDGVRRFAHGNQFDKWHTPPIKYDSIHVSDKFYDEYIAPMMAFVLETPAYFYRAGLEKLKQYYETIYDRYNHPDDLNDSLLDNNVTHHDKYMNLFTAKNPATCETYVDYGEMYKEGIAPLAALVQNFDFDNKALSFISANTQPSDDILPEVLSTMRYNLFFEFQRHGEKMPNLILPYLHPKLLYEAMSVSASKHDLNRLMAFFENFLVNYVSKYYPLQLSKNQQRWYNLSVGDIITLVSQYGAQLGKNTTDLIGPRSVWSAPQP